MKTWLKAAAATALLLALFLPRIFDLDAFRAPDEDRWIARTAGFTRSLAHGRFEQLLQSPTPGVTTHWLGALTIRYKDWQIKKLPIAIGQALLIALAGYLGWRLWGKTTAIILTILLALNPHLIAHSRVYGTDALMPVFIIISFLSIFLWQKEKSTRYLILSGLTAAAAVLSKLPGIIFAPVIILPIITQYRHNGLPSFAQGYGRAPRVTGYSLRNWSLAFIAGAIILLPSLALAPLSIIGDFLEIFRSAEYTQAHTTDYLYYPRMLLFTSTPLGLSSIILIPAAFYLYRKVNNKKDNDPKQALLLIAAAVLFFAVMSYGSKKGYRYLLPIFALTDVMLALAVTWLIRIRRSKPSPKATILLAAAAFLFVLQVIDTARLHPHVMAYTNPLTRRWFQNQGYGWGEGLDLAAAYLNEKPNAGNLTAASIYPSEFGHYFKGKTKPAHQHDEGVDYIVIYRNMLSRGPDAWETDVVNQYKNKEPEKIISFTGVPFVWIYKR